jgi:FkbH-like protein
LEKIKGRPLEVAMREIAVPLISSFETGVEPSLSVNPDISLAIMVISASLAAENKEEFLENLDAIVDLICYVKEFRYKATEFEASGFRDDVILSILPQIAKKAGDSKKFQEAIKLEKISINLKRTIPQIVRFYEGYCSEDNIGFNGFYETRYVLPISILSLPAKKCLVLDCDGVLWGGIVGEDGVEKIVLSEDYLTFQKRLWKLKEEGILLVLNSRNSMQDVEEVFKRRPEMVLKWEDFVAVRVNFEDKASNIEALARELNVSTDSMVFFDDSPQERSFVTYKLPEVLVPDIPEDPSRYTNLIDALDVLGIFVERAVTGEDRMRTELIRANVEREKFHKRTRSDEEYYFGLDVIVEIRNAEREDIPRVVQLMDRTNQFNLVKKHYTEEHIQNLLDRPDYEIYILKYKDKYSKSRKEARLAFIVLRKRDKATWDIDSFCVSCTIPRTSRTVAQALISYVTKNLKEREVKLLVGTYIPTHKNVDVRDLYEEFGFDKINDVKEMTTWNLNLDDKTVAMPPWIKIKEKPKGTPATLNAQRNTQKGASPLVQGRSTSPVTSRIYANAEVNFSIFPVRTNLIETHIPNIYEFAWFQIKKGIK